MSLAFVLFALVVSSVGSCITCVIGAVGAIGISMAFPRIHGRGLAKRGLKTTLAEYILIHSARLVAGQRRKSSRLLVIL